MSSHREAPEISKDPVADSTDLYAFVSPDAPDTVTFIANYVPLETPAGGPNFYEFGDDVLYEINIDTTAMGAPTLSTSSSSTPGPRTRIRSSTHRPINSLNDPDWNRRQFYTVTRVDAYGHKKVLGRNLQSPPCNVGVLSPRIMLRSPEPRCTRCPVAAASSPASARTASTWTSDPSSTFSISARSRR